MLTYKSNSWKEAKIQTCPVIQVGKFLISLKDLVHVRSHDIDDL